MGSRRGKELELLVATLEKMLGGSNFEIKVNDRIPDKDTGELREIDVSLRLKAGSHEFLTIIECRDRKAVPGAPWIEQLASKRDSVGANKAVAVSSSGFSKPAVKKARIHNIIVRTIDKITLADVSKWMQAETIEVIGRYSEIVEIANMTLSGKGIKTDDLMNKIDEFIRPAVKDFDKPLFFEPKTNRHPSLRNIWTESQMQNPEQFNNWFRQAEDSGERLSIRWCVKTRPHLVLEPFLPRCWVSQITFHARLWVEKKKVSPRQIVQYTEGEKGLSQMVRFIFDMGGEEVSVDFLKGRDAISLLVTRPDSGNMNINVTFVEDTKD